MWLPDWADWETGMLLPDYDQAIRTVFCMCWTLLLKNLHFWFVTSHREGVRGAELLTVLTNHNTMLAVDPLITAYELRQL